MKRLRRVCLLVILVLIAIAPLFAATYSSDAFMKLKALAGDLGRARR